jgi:CHAT domain-containing protein
MRLPKIGLTAVLPLVATLTISDFPLIQNPQSPIQNSQVLAQTPAIRKAQANRLLHTLIAQNKTDAALEIVERNRARALLELFASRLSSNVRAQNFTAQQVSIAPLTIEQIKQTAREHRATLVEYSIINDDVQGKQQTQESDLLIWVISPSGEVTLRRVNLKPLLKQNTSLSDLIITTREAIGLRSSGLDSTVEKRQFKDKQSFAAPKGHLGVTPREKPGTNGLQQLYQLLIQPIADLLPSDPNARVIFIPQDSLFLVPFAALQDATGKYLIEHYSILTAPSIQVLQFTHQQRQRVGYGEFLVVGNPAMSNVPPKPGERSPLLPNLPGAEQEAKTIAQLLNTQAIIGKDATKAAILEKMPRARIIHLATNAIADNERGIGSAIALAPSGNDNGLLTAEEIQNLKLNAELVVLSGCDTGLGKITADGVIGLSRSFIAAGVPSAIVSLGDVSDEATAFLMSEFYRNLQQNSDKAQALRQAMLMTMKNYPNPLDWGAFTLIGEAE